MWHSVEIIPSDRIPINSSSNLLSDQTSIKISTQEFFAQEQFIQTLIYDHQSSFEIPSDSISLNLISSEFFPLINQIINQETLSNDLNLWISFGNWLGMKGSFKKRQVYRHLKNIWSKTQNVIKLRQQQQPIPTFFNTISKQHQAEIIESAYQTFKSISDLSHYRHIIYPECITDEYNQTLIHFGFVDDFDAVIKATNAINDYYFHTLNNPTHRSFEFWKDFVEHFGTYSRNNTLPFISKHTASSHNIDHLPCVNLLLQNLEPLSNSINCFIKNNYPSLYSKLIQLSWGPFGPKPFGIFPMIAINFNTISDYHWDSFDDPNCLYCLMAFGDFEGGELNFSQLNIVIHLKPYQIVAFSSRLLLHGNFPFVKGIRYSIVYFIHDTFFKHRRTFDILETQKELESDSNLFECFNAQGLNSQTRLLKPLKQQINIPEDSKDKRRNHICKYQFLFYTYIYNIYNY